MVFLNVSPQLRHGKGDTNTCELCERSLLDALCFWKLGCKDLPFDVLDEPSPLGLRLRKGPSLLDLIQMKLSQEKSVREQFDVHNDVSDTPMEKKLSYTGPALAWMR